MPAPRIVSLLPAATEWVYALGLQDHLLGVTAECDHPSSARTDNAVVVQVWDTAGLDPSEVDRRLRDRRRSGLTTHQLDVPLMQELAPTVVLTQDLCGVCALPAHEVEAARAAVGDPGEVVTLDPTGLTSVLAGAVQVARACGDSDRGSALQADLLASLGELAGRVARRRPPRVLVLEWVDPPFPAGHWIPDVVHAAGGAPVLSFPGEATAAMTWPGVRDALADEPGGADSVDVVLVAPCGYGLDAAVAQARSVVGVLTRLMPGAAVVAMDADAALTRPGPRLVEGAWALASVLHPGAVPERPDLVRRVR